MQAIINTIKKAMIDKGIKTPELIERTGLSKNTVYEFLSGKRRIWIDGLLKIMDVLDLEVRRVEKYFLREAQGLQGRGAAAAY